MGLIKDLIGKKIFLDTAPLIYYIEEHSYFAPLLNELILLKYASTTTTTTSMEGFPAKSDV
jgi:hypothetical protein